MIKQWRAFLLAFVVPIALVAWWWGVFNPVQVEEAVRGPYRFAYQEVLGDYTNLPQRQQSVLRILDGQNVLAGASVTELYSDPRVVVDKKLQKARVGYLIPANAAVHDPLMMVDIPQRRVLLAHVKAQPLIAPGKAYGALLDYLKQRNMKFVLPTLEIYQDRALSVEMDL